MSFAPRVASCLARILPIPRLAPVIQITCKFTASRFTFPLDNKVKSAAEVRNLNRKTAIKATKMDKMKMMLAIVIHFRFFAVE
nr:hypothetical protein Iba_chr03eCG6180 [Ipomoea batatas]